MHVCIHTNELYTYTHMNTHKHLCMCACVCALCVHVNVRACCMSVLLNCFEYHLLHLCQLNTCKSVQYTNMHVTDHVDAAWIHKPSWGTGGVSTSCVGTTQL